MTRRELELVARLIWRTKTGNNMPDRAPLDDYERGAMDRHCAAALGGLNEQARAIGAPGVGSYAESQYEGLTEAELWARLRAQLDDAVAKLSPEARAAHDASVRDFVRWFRDGAPKEYRQAPMHEEPSEGWEFSDLGHRLWVRTVRPLSEHVV